jgi:hypothetical protein
MASGYVEDRLWVACMDMLAGADVASLAIGCTPARPGQWWAVAVLADAIRVTVHANSPVLALAALTERAALGMTCACGKPIVLSDRAQHAHPNGCRWVQEGRTFVPLLPKHPLPREEHRL